MTKVVDPAQKPKIYSIYREYTGQCFEIRAIATDKISGVVSVVFRGWPDFRVGWFTVPLETFNSTIRIPADEVPTVMMDFAEYVDEGSSAIVPRYVRRVP